MDASNPEESQKLSPRDKLSIQHNLEKEPLRTGLMSKPGVQIIEDVHMWSGRVLMLILALMLLLLGLATNYLAGGVVTWYVEKCLEIISNTK